LVSNNYFGQVVVTDTDEDRLAGIFGHLTIDKRLFKVNFGKITELDLKIHE
jgi:hypothetical protein